VATLHDPAVRATIMQLGGYDTTDSGLVHELGP
jgi:hypothetical protein